MHRFMKKVIATGIAAMCFATAAVPAHAMDPILPFRDVKGGMTGTAYTVVDSSGEIRSFDVDIVGNMDNGKGSSRMIMARARGPVTACVYPIEREGTEIFTNTPKIRQMRKTNLELLLSNHNKKCLSCPRSTNCELQKLCVEYGVDEDRFVGAKTETKVDHSSASIVRDNSKCILCRR